MSDKKIIFKKRVPEPKIMGKVEMRAFEKLSTQNYKRWLIPLVDDVLANNKKQNSMAIGLWQVAYGKARPCHRPRELVSGSEINGC